MKYQTVQKFLRFIAKKLFPKIYRELSKPCYAYYKWYIYNKETDTINVTPFYTRISPGPGWKRGTSTNRDVIFKVLD